MMKQLLASVKFLYEEAKPHSGCTLGSGSRTVFELIYKSIAQENVQDQQKSYTAYTSSQLCHPLAG